jgi:hypothetical protein
MSNHPYAPPSASLRDAPRPPKSPIVSVVAGIAIDLVGSLLAGGVLGIIYAASLTAQGMSEQEVSAALENIPVGSWFFVFGTSVGLAFSFLGGYVCARLARKDELRLGAIVGAISAVAGMLFGAEYYGSALNLLMAALVVIVVLAGAIYGRRRNVAAALA